MPTWGPGNEIDPEFATGVASGFGKPGTPVWDKIKELAGIVGDGWRQIGQGIKYDIEQRGEAEDEPVRLAEDVATDAYEQWHSREPGPGGANEYGAEVPSDPNEARPGIRPRAINSTAVPMPDNSVQSGTPPVPMPDNSVSEGLPPVPMPNIVVLRPTEELQEPSEGDAWLQQRLTDLGFDPGGVDGFAGPNTIGALNEFLAETGFDVQLQAGDEIPEYVLQVLGEL